MTTPSPGASAGRRRAVRPVGDRALLVECVDLAEVHGLHAALEARPLPGVAESLPAARTVLVRLSGTDRSAGERLAEQLAVMPVTAPDLAAAGEVEVEVVYDGEDLHAVATALGESVDGLVAAHAAEPWTAAFIGFAPGFAYLERDGGWADIARRPTPRTSVPAGSVALAGPYSAVYPRSTPGGWQLIGRTTAAMWDLGREVPALVRAGTRVRFRPVRDRVHARATTQPTATQPTATRPTTTQPTAPIRGPALEVVDPGVQALVQDLGRPGHLALGVGASGALDRRSAVRANRLVGNARGAAVVETVLGGLVVRSHGRSVLAVTGAPAPSTVHAADGSPRPAPVAGTPFALGDGDVLTVGTPTAGMRCYLAVRGGVGAGLVLGSRATDVLSGLGPPPLRAGDVLPVLPPPGDAVAGWPDPEDAGAGPTVRVRVRLGPRADWLTDRSVDRLVAQAWTVTPQSNRVGLRLAGEPLERAVTGELPSEGVVAGAVQVPPSGLPVVFLADHPVTGGYPVAAVVLDADLDGLAQLRPGDRLELAAVGQRSTGTSMRLPYSAQPPS